MESFPEIQWAQGKGQLHIKFNVEVERPVDLTVIDTELHFRAKSGSKEYRADVEFYQPVKSSEMNSPVITGQEVRLTIPTSQESDSWPRLTKSASKNNHIKPDFDHMFEGDSDEEFPPLDLGGGGFDEFDDMGEQSGSGEEA